MKRLLIFGVIAILTLVGAQAYAGGKKGAAQSEEGSLTDQTAPGHKGMGFSHIIIANLVKEGEDPDTPGLLFADITATLRLRVAGDLAVFQARIPHTLVGEGFPVPDYIQDFFIRDAILNAFSSPDGRPAGIVADIFFPGEGFAATLKVLEEDVQCGGAEIHPTDTTIVGCPLGPDPVSYAEIIKVADITIAFAEQP